MNDKPLIISLLIGLVVVLVIMGVSLLVKMNSLSDSYKKELSKGISLAKSAEDLKVENDSLKTENSTLVQKNAELDKQIKDASLELEKINKLKDKLEENLKDELMKNEGKKEK